MDSRKHENWACIGSHDQFSALQIWNWNSSWVRESRQFSFLGQNFLWNGQICGRFYSRQHRNSCRSTRRASSTKQVQAWLQPGQRQKQNLNRKYSLGQQQPYQYMKGDGLTLSHQNKILPRTISRRKWSIFFDTIKRYSEKKMEQLNSTKSNSIFEIIIHKYRIGLMIVGKLVRLQEEDRNEDISIALIIREQFSISVLFKDILDIISLILRYRTMWRLELEYSLTFTTSDAHSIFILLSTMDWYLEVKIWAEDKQCSSCLLIQEMKVTETLNMLISLYHVERNTCTVHGRGTKTRYSGLILILRSEKDSHSIKHDRMQLFFKGHFQLIAFQKLKDWRLEKSYMRKHTCHLDHHQRSH